MKKLVAVAFAAAIMVLCIGCGPYGDYSGTYVMTSNGATCTITLSASGKFKFVRKLSETSSEYGGLFDDDKYNVREGTFTVENGKITINYKVYNQPYDTYDDAVSTAKLSGNKLIVSREGAVSDVYGTFTKK